MTVHDSFESRPVTEMCIRSYEDTSLPYPVPGGVVKGNVLSRVEINGVVFTLDRVSGDTAYYVQDETALPYAG